MSNYNPAAWFWVIGGDESQIYSSVLPGLVPAADPSYIAWLDAGHQPTRIASLDELQDVLLVQAPHCWPKSRQDVWEDIKAERDRRRFEGGVKVGDHWFLSTAIATSEYNSLILMSAGLPDTTVLRADWRTMDGAKVDMTPALVKQILAAGFAQIATIDDVAQTHRAALEASVNPEAYDFSMGWPKIFGEE